jgi:hypothetical protein
VPALLLFRALTLVGLLAKSMGYRTLIDELPVVTVTATSPMQPRRSWKPTWVRKMDAITPQGVKNITTTAGRPGPGDAEFVLKTI